MLRTRVALLLTTLSLLAPLGAQAADSLKLIAGPDDAHVSRGDMLRAAIEVLGISHDDTGAVADQRVPRSLVPYVNAAASRDALDVFGDGPLLLARDVTRGEAIMLLQQLEQLDSHRTVNYQDVPHGSDLEAGIMVALDEGWMEPVESAYFGAADPLTVKEARLLLRKVQGEGGMEVSLPGDTSVIAVPRSGPVNRELPEEEMLRTVWQLLVDHYVEQEKLDPKEAAYRAATAMVESVKDPYTTFMRPVEAEDFQMQLEGAITGIGAQVEQKEGVIVVITPLEGSPAEKAGLRPGDLIEKADGIDLKDMNFLEAVGKIRGPKGTPVTLTISRGGNPLEIVVTRDTITVPEITVSTNGTVKVVKLMQFGEIAERDFRRTMAEVVKAEPTGIILDLRNNPGGLLDTAAVVLSALLPEESTVSWVVSRDGTEEIVTWGEQVVPSDIPMVVLINKGSASASEIVAGALQDAGRARVIGETSYGKGTVQNLVPLNDGSSLKFTTAKWLTPAKRAINELGITPDEVVEQEKGDRDTQLLRALESVTAQTRRR